MRKIIFALSVLFICIAVMPLRAWAEQPEVFVKRYIETVHSDKGLDVYSAFWRSKAQKYLHDTTEGLQKEFGFSAKMHDLFLQYGGFSNAVDTNVWGDTDNTISYTYSLSQSVPNDVMQKYFKQGPAEYKEYQITIEQEDGKWVVSGESIVGTM